MVEPLKFDGFGELSEPLSCKRSNFDKLSKLSKDALKKIQFLPAKKQESLTSKSKQKNAFTLSVGFENETISMH